MSDSYPSYHASSEKLKVWIKISCYIPENNRDNNTIYILAKLQETVP